MSDLRDRIAAALKAQAEFRGIYKIADFDFPFLADAVIRELDDMGVIHLSKVIHIRKVRHNDE